ncbi:MAG TPA: transposase [Balneola sp.]|jgi:putative transposase|nr:transposase [Balneola sp.]|tara:strand:- start:749 stop:1324 length:576 start_codon:yes stop_codon:yes gene_type:complete
MNQKKLPNRRSMRLQGYDYSSPGFYFITICTNQKECLFGGVINGEMHMNECGVVASNYLKQIDTRYPNTIIHEHIVMPNHIHVIIEIVNTIPFVGAIHESPLQRNANPELYRNHRRKMLIPKIIGWYKMNTAKQINQIRKTPGAKIWQRGYYDHIIRNEESLCHIREYIKNNPMNWNKDRFHLDLRTFLPK